MQVILKIRRNSKKSTGYWEEFEVTDKSGMTVASALRAIQRHPVNRDGKASSPVSWDSQCYPVSCGACTMIINGHAAQACETFLKNLDQPITLEPLSKFKLLRDLMIDRESRVNHKLNLVRHLDGFYALNLPLLPRGDKDQLVLAAKRCVECQACVEACPQSLLKSEFVGAAALAKGYEQHLEGNSSPELFLSQSGVLGCDNTQNCVRVCPQQIPLTEMIGALKRQAGLVFFKQLLG